MTTMLDSAELVSSDLIMREVLIRCDDEALRKGLTRGYYQSQVEKALEKLAINTFFSDMPPLDQPMPKNGRWPIPDNFFDICELYAWNGTCCDVTNLAPIYYKRLFNNAPNGPGYTAMNMGSNQAEPDPFFSQPWPVGGFGNNLLYANIQNGTLMFSTGCLTYDNFRVIYRGFGNSIGQKPVVPRPLREIVEDLCVLNAARVLRTKNPKSVYGALIEETYNKIYNRQNGTWHEAENFVKGMSSWVKECRNLYFGKWGNW